MQRRALSPPIRKALHAAFVLHVYSMLAFQFTDQPWLCLMFVPALLPARIECAGAIAVALTIEYGLSLLFIPAPLSRSDAVVSIACFIIPVVIAIAMLAGRFISPHFTDAQSITWRGLISVLRTVCPLLAAAALILTSSRFFPLSVPIACAATNVLAAFALPRAVSNHPRKPLATAGILGFSVLVSLGILEVGTRLVMPDTVPQPGIFKPHPKAIVDLHPLAERTLTFRASPSTIGYVPVRISSQGIREKTYGPKAPDEFRVLLLGDSFTFGLTVSFADTIGRLLEKELERCQLSKKVTVINLGVPGTGPWQQQIYLEERGFQFEPDLVIQQLYLGNDMHDTLMRTGRLLQSFDPKREEQIQRQRLLAKDRFRVEQWLAEHSFAYAVVRHWIGEQTVADFLAHDCRYFESVRIPPLPEPSGLPPGWEVNQEEWYPEITDAMDEIVKTVNVTRTECLQRGVDFAVYTIPLLEEAAPSQYDRARRMFGVPPNVSYRMGKGLNYLNARWKELDIPIIPVFRCMRADPAPATLYRISDGHTSEAGNAVIAQCIRDFIVNVYLPTHPMTVSKG